MNKQITAAIIFFSLSGFHVSGQTDPDTKTCLDCHGNLVKQQVIHAVAQDDCENCHTSSGNQHPQANVKGFTLADKVPSLCFMCHEENTKKNIHPPAEEGECLLCHSPHGSENKALLLKNPQSLICADCHDMAMTEKKVKHKPVAEGSCTSCHDPHQSDITYMLKKDKSQLCMDCHVSVSIEAGKKNLHPPFEDDCNNCHDTHSADNVKLLNLKVPELCFTCHDMQSEFEKAGVVHKVVFDEKGCNNCHSPHASDQQRFLIKPGKDLCLTCHNQEIEEDGRIIQNIGSMLKTGNVIHGAIEMDGCLTCHDPHVSDQPNLLQGSFPVGQYANAVTESFGLCFTCHDSELLTAQNSTTATYFRNGDQNLHYKHINGEKGRNCNICHNIHGAAGAHLINENVKFGNWNMPVRYKAEENGGSCSPGCHSEKKYRR